MKDRDFLIWLHNRLASWHREDQGADYMRKLRAIISTTSPDKETPNNFGMDDIQQLQKFLKDVA